MIFICVNGRCRRQKEIPFKSTARIVTGLLKSPDMYNRILGNSTVEFGELNSPGRALVLATSHLTSSLPPAFHRRRKLYIQIAKLRKIVS